MASLLSISRATCKNKLNSYITRDECRYSEAIIMDELARLENHQFLFTLPTIQKSGQKVGRFLTYPTIWRMVGKF